MPEAHFLGREAPDNPLAEVLADEVRSLAREGGPSRGVVSARYGDRCTVSAPDVDLGRIRDDDFTEVVEYDPHGDRLLLLGPSEPDPLAAVHSLVYRAREEVGAILQLELPRDHPAHEALPAASTRGSTLDRTLDLLEKLREADAVTLADRWVFAVGESPQAARHVVEDVLEEGGPREAAS